MLVERMQKPLPIQEESTLEERESKGTAGVLTTAGFTIVSSLAAFIGGFYMCLDVNKDVFASIPAMQLYAEKSGCGKRDVSGSFYWVHVPEINPRDSLTVQSIAPMVSGVKAVNRGR